MRVLIVYAGRTGTTEKAAKILAQYFENASLRNLMETDANPDRDYDAVLIRSSVRNGLIEPKIRKWLVKHEKNLSGMRKGVFLCHAFMTESHEIIARNFPDEFIRDCEAIDSFGGEVDYSKLKLSERIALKSLFRKHPETESMVPCLVTDAIAAFAQKMKI